MSLKNEEHGTQHKLLVADVTVNGYSPRPCIVAPTRKLCWNFRNPTFRKDYETFVNEKCTELLSNKKPVGVNDAWKILKSCLLNGVDQIYGWTVGDRVRHAETC